MTADTNIGQKLLDVPFPEMIFKMASAIAESQLKLDKASIDILRIMGDKKNCPVYLPKVTFDSSGKLLEDDGDIVTSMIGAGFQPTFYQFVETMIEVQMTMSATNEGEEPIVKTVNKVEPVYYRDPYYYGYFYSRAPRLALRVTPVDASYVNKYNFSQVGTSTLKTRLVPMPPNPFIQRLLDMKSQAMQQQFELELKKIELDLAKEQAAVADRLIEAERVARGTSGPVSEEEEP